MTNSQQHHPMDRVITWKENEVWKSGEVREVDGGDFVVDLRGETRRVCRHESTIELTPTSLFKNTPHPRSVTSRSFMNALREQVEASGIEPDTLTVVWCDNRPYGIFPPSVPDDTVESICDDIDRVTRPAIDPAKRALDSIRI